MMTTAEDTTRRAAICLNNYAVALIEHGAHRHASETMRDAISLMQIILQQREEQQESPATDQLLHHPPASPSLLASVNAKIEAASKRLADARYPSPTTSSTRKSRKARRVIKVNVASYYDDGGFLQPDSSQYSLIDLTPSSSDSPTVFVAVPIRLDHSSSVLCSSPPGSCNSKSELERLAGIMLYNFGLSHLCLFRTHSRTTGATALAENSLRLFNAAMDMIDIDVEGDKTNMSSTAATIGSVHDVIMLQYVILRHAAHALMEIKKYSAAQECFKQMLEILDFEGGTIIGVCESNNAAAPAA